MHTQKALEKPHCASTKRDGLPSSSARVRFVEKTHLFTPRPLEEEKTHSHTHARRGENTFTHTHTKGSGENLVHTHTHLLCEPVKTHSFTYAQKDMRKLIGPLEFARQRHKR